jgi:hypothetical protein
MEFKKYPENKPKKYDTCLCKCPTWRDIGFEVAYFDGNKFDDKDLNNDFLDEAVESFCVIEDDE